jgi:hypothetical protein
MGADGHIVIAKRSDWDAANPEVKPDDIGLYEGVVLGVDACWGYHGDNLFGPNYGYECFMEEDYVGDKFVPLSESEKANRKKALQWFRNHSEWHEVWT